MLDIKDKKVYLACGVTDMRKSIDTLSVIVQNSFNLDLYGDSVFIFCNRARDRIKILEWDEDGFYLHLKRLEMGKFNWPAVATDEKTMSLSCEELALMLRATKLNIKLGRNRIYKGRVA
jgi:transposase